MKKLAKYLTLAVVVTFAFGLYLYFARTVRVTLISASFQNASERGDYYDSLVSAARRGEAGLTLLSDAYPENASDCAFLTLTYRVQNYGLLPAEWLTISVTPEGGDILQIDPGEIDIGALSGGEITVTLLVSSASRAEGREAQAWYYVLGKRLNVGA